MNTFFYQNIEDIFTQSRLSVYKKTELMMLPVLPDICSILKSANPYILPYIYLKLR